MADVEGGMSELTFRMLVFGLSRESRFLDAYSKKPHTVSTPDQIALITGRYLGGE